MNIQEIAHRIREEHRKYANKEGMDWAMLAAAKIKAEMQSAKRLTDEEIDSYARTYTYPYSIEIKRALTKFRDNGYFGGLAVEEALEVVDARYGMNQHHRKELQDLFAAKLSSK